MKPSLALKSPSCLLLVGKWGKRCPPVREGMEVVDAAQHSLGLWCQGSATASPCQLPLPASAMPQPYTFQGLPNTLSSTQGGQMPSQGNRRPREGGTNLKVTLQTCSAAPAWCSHRAVTRTGTEPRCQGTQWGRRQWGTQWGSAASCQCCGCYL